jgi:hypothetical protein
MKWIVYVMASLFVALAVAPVSAEVNVGISIGIPSPLVFAEPPDVVVVPSGSAYVYMVPDTPGLYFYNNFWYRFHGGRWYRSRIYNGSWGYIQTSRVPRFVLDVPPDYYTSLPSGYYRIHYGDLHRHWRSWDRGRHWNRYDWYRHEHDRRGHDRGRHLHDGRGRWGDGHGMRDGGYGRRDGGHRPPDDGRGMKRYGGGQWRDGGGIQTGPADKADRDR